jgi:hypothetical protein
MEILARSDNIFYVRDLISLDLCRRCIELYERDPRKHPGQTTKANGEGHSEPELKLSTDLDLATDGIWTAVFAELHAAVTSATHSIAAQFPSLEIHPLQCTGYKIQHYKKNQGHFKWHFDALGPNGWDRQLAIIIYLNTVADGGETAFYRQNLKIKPVATDALFFPPFWTHMHCGETPRSDDKYIISTFIRFVLPTIHNCERVG